MGSTFQEAAARSLHDKAEHTASVIGFGAWVAQQDENEKGSNAAARVWGWGQKACSLAKRLYRLYPAVQTALTAGQGAGQAFNFFNEVQDVYRNVLQAMNVSVHVGRYVELGLNSALLKNHDALTDESKGCLMGEMVTQSLLDVGLNLTRGLVETGVRHLLLTFFHAAAEQLSYFALFEVSKILLKWFEEQVLTKLLSNSLSYLGVWVETFIAGEINPVLGKFFGLLNEATNVLRDLNQYWVTPLTAKLVPKVVQFLQPYVQKYWPRVFKELYSALPRSWTGFIADQVSSLLDTFFGASAAAFSAAEFSEVTHSFLEQGQGQGLTHAVNEAGCAVGSAIPDVVASFSGLSPFLTHFDAPTQPSPGTRYHFRGELIVEHKTTRYDLFDPMGTTRSWADDAVKFDVTEQFIPPLREEGEHTGLATYRFGQFQTLQDRGAADEEAWLVIGRMVLVLGLWLGRVVVLGLVLKALLGLNFRVKKLCWEINRRAVYTRTNRCKVLCELLFLRRRAGRGMVAPAASAATRAPMLPSASSSSSSLVANRSSSVNKINNNWFCRDWSQYTRWAWLTSLFLLALLVLLARRAVQWWLESQLDSPA